MGWSLAPLLKPTKLRLRDSFVVDSPGDRNRLRSSSFDHRRAANPPIPKPESTTGRRGGRLRLGRKATRLKSSR
jgi:hypothetical protein